MSEAALDGQAIEYPETDGQPLPDSFYQRQAIIDLELPLRALFEPRVDVLVGADNFIYFKEEHPSERLAPDLYVAFGCSPDPNRTRLAYKAWEEPCGMPQFVLEVASPSTWRHDQGEKKALYAELGVLECWLFDPQGQLLEPALQGFRLVDGAYAAIQGVRGLDGGRTVRSAVLGLDFRLLGRQLRLYNPATGEFLPTPAEEREGRLQESEGRLQAERKAESAMRKAEFTKQQLRQAQARIAELEAASGNQPGSTRRPQG